MGLCQISQAMELCENASKSMSIIQQVNNVFFPYICPICKKNHPEKDHGICKSCDANLNYIQSPFCRECGGTVDGVLDVCGECLDNPRPWNIATSIFEFNGLGRHIVHQYKYSGNVALTRFLAHAMYSVGMNSSCERGYDLIVPVPLHWLKRLSRGYNQTELLAKELSRLAQIPACDILRRHKWTQSQARLNRKMRKKNLKNAFTVKNSKAKIVKNSVLLLDDVFTTGSTLTECAQVLLAAGSESVDVLTLAKG